MNFNYYTQAASVISGLSPAPFMLSNANHVQQVMDRVMVNLPNVSVVINRIDEALKYSMNVPAPIAFNYAAIPNINITMPTFPQQLFGPQPPQLPIPADNIIFSM